VRHHALVARVGLRVLLACRLADQESRHVKEGPLTIFAVELGLSPTGLGDGHAALPAVPCLAKSMRALQFLPILAHRYGYPDVPKSSGGLILVGGRLLFTRCCNLPIQGICADAMLRAIVRTHAVLKDARIRGGLVACVHDELLLEVHEDDAEIARELLEYAMIGAFTETFPGAPVDGVATAKIGQTWAEVK
jgi:hypothetical protein